MAWNPLSRRNWLISTALLSPALLGVAEPDAPSAASNSLGARTYDIRDFGAKGNGKTLDTKAFQAAIDACA